MTPEERSSWKARIEAQLAPRETLITPGRLIDREIMDVLRKGDRARVEEMLVPEQSRDGCLVYRFESRRPKCDKQGVFHFIKSGFLYHIFTPAEKMDNGDWELYCESCREAASEANMRLFELAERELDERIKRDADWEAAKQTRTKEWIGGFLNHRRQFAPHVNMHAAFGTLEAQVKDLDLDLIKDAIQCMEYRDFLLTPYWKAVAGEVKHRAGNACALCNSKSRLQAHHKTYANHGLEMQRLDSDLICLCEKCHATFHGITPE